MNYFLALGSNEGKREILLDRARKSLEEIGIRVLRSSSVYETQPVDCVDQPWFLNQVLEVRTQRLPLELLKAAKAIEKKMGRRTSFPKGPRQIDIDILLNEDLIFHSQKLIIPHPRLHKRKFILTALREISPKIIHPVFKVTIDKLWRDVEDTSEVKIFSPHRAP